jgi:hypothetical protein
MGLRPNLFMPCADLFSKIEPLRTPKSPGNCWISRQNPPLKAKRALRLGLALRKPGPGYEEGTFMGGYIYGRVG